jgi:predicted dehydrogenase
MKVAVLGAGGMGGTVVKHLQDSPLISSIVAYDINSERAVHLQKKYDNVVASGNLESLLSDKEVELVFVTSSNNAHKELTMQSLKAGKAVMCEKPMANTLEDCVEMVETAERTKGFLQIGFELRYSRMYTQVKRWIEEGLLGDVVNTNCCYICSEFHGKGSWRNKKSTGGSMFNEKLSHYVDLPRWWINSRVTDVITMSSPNVIPYYEVRDNYHTTYRFQNGAVSHLTFMMAVGAKFGGDPLKNTVDQQQGDGHELRYLIEGTKGAVETDVFRRLIKRWEFRDGPTCLESHWVDTLTYTADEEQLYIHNTYNQTLDIVKRVAEGLPPGTFPRDSLETMKLCFAAEVSADTGKIVKI